MTVPTDSEVPGNAFSRSANSPSQEPLDQSFTGSISDSQTAYSDQNWEDPEYVPEREFVLMPLFRRIGEKLGLRKQPATVSEPNYRVEARPARVADAAALPEQQLPPIEQPAQDQHFEPEAPQDPLARHIYVAQTDLEPEPLALTNEPEIEPFEPVMPPPAAREQSEHVEEPAVFHRSNEPTYDVEPAAHRDSAIFDQPSPTLAPVSVPTSQRKDVTAPFREAALSISAAMSRAAEWLHQKEEAILQRSQSPLSATNRAQSAAEAEQEQLVSPPQAAVEPLDPAIIAQSEAAATISPVPTTEVAPPWKPEPAVNQWEQADAPALQREMAWLAGEKTRLEASANPVAGPQLVSASAKQKSAPLWKRVNWSEQFTPQRVAVLGAIGMAILLVLGISFGRGPAASMLPPQTEQVRSLQPGGVTVTTHQSRPIAAVPGRSAAKTASPTRSTSPSTARRASVNVDNEPDVVTHYYKKEKPSPAHQATVAGVPHFSDLE